MRSRMAAHAQCDEILRRVIPEPAFRADVVDLQAGRGATTLAPPSITVKHLPVELLVRFCGEAEALVPGPRPAHADFRSRAEKDCFNSSGSSSYSRHIARSMARGDWLSSPAPAKKSAQIISKQ